MTQDEPLPPPVAERRAPERVAVDIALHLGLIAVFAFLAIDLLRPFFGLLAWTVVIAAALHPAYVWLARRLGGRRGLAAALVTAVALLVVLGPIAMLAASAVDSALWIHARIHAGGIELPDPPRMLVDLPAGVGAAITSNWELATSNLEGFLARYGRTLLGAGEAAALPAFRFAEGVAIFLAAVALSGFLHLSGEGLGAAARRSLGRVLGARNARFVDIATATIRNVARGVIGVAVAQALLIGVGLIAAGVPAAGVLTLVALVFAIVQIGVWPLVLPVLAWVWMQDDTMTATLLTAWLLPAALADVALKPLMLGSSLGTPRLVIFAGVIAGAVSYGLIGLFLGPILLALAYEVAMEGLYGDGDPTAARRGGIE